MGGNIFRALQRNNNLQSVVDLIGAIRKKALQEDERNAMFNRISKYQGDVQNASNSAIIPGKPAQEANVPYLLANPNLQGAPVPKSSTPYNLMKPETPKPDIIGGLIDQSIPGVKPASTQAPTEDPQSIRTTTPASPARYDVNKHEQKLAELNVGLLKDMAGMEYLSPEDRATTLNIADILNRANAPHKPVVMKMGDNESLVSYDPQNPNGIQTIANGKKKPFTLGSSAAFGYDDQGNVDFTKPLYERPSTKTEPTPRTVGNDGYYYDWDAKSNSFKKTNLKAPSKDYLSADQLGGGKTPDYSQNLGDVKQAFAQINQLKEQLYDPKGWVDEYKDDKGNTITLPEKMKKITLPDGKVEYFTKKDAEQYKETLKKGSIESATQLVNSQGLMNVVNEIQNGLNLIINAKQGKPINSQDIDKAVANVLTQNNIKLQPEIKNLLYNYFSLMGL